MMATHSDTVYGTYRCPVCGHRDAAELAQERSSMVVACSYCDTPLEISTRGTDSVRFAVQVADESAHR
jgi:DNA-directed RNA polymerase subunit RPC12/RpoP